MDVKVKTIKMLATVTGVLKRNKLSILVLVLTWAAFFSRTLTGQLVYFLDDLKIIYYPLEHAYAQFQASWRLPVWSNLFGFGHPLIAWGQLGFFTPLHLLLRVFHIHPLTLLQISIITYFGIGLAGMYTFLRYRRLAQPAAVLGAVTYVFSGFHVGHLNHVNFYTATMLLPWLLVALLYLSNRRTLQAAALVALLAAAMALSGQPQIVTYSYLIAALTAILHLTPRAINKARLTRIAKIASLLAVAGALAFSLASFAILPLAEFLPVSDRAAGLTRSQLYEFSYPPLHAITLIFPYFFGDHDAYWGAKGFQELAAYVGILPLLLAGGALANWRSFRVDRMLGLALIALSISFALGRYSPLYFWLVDSRIITSLAIPGRFVFFFTTGITLLAALGLDDLLKKRTSQATLVAALALPALILLPFALTLDHDQTIARRWSQLLNSRTPDLYAIGAGLVLWITAPLLTTMAVAKKFIPYLLPGAAAITLIIYGWSYNPLTVRQAAYAHTSVSDTLLNAKTNALPPRLFVSRHPGAGISQRTEAISPQFTVHQPITVQQDNLSCLRVPIRLDDDAVGTIKMQLREELSGEPIRELTISSEQVTTIDPQLCFPPVPDSRGNEFIVSFSSDDHSGLRLLYTPHKLITQRVYFVRVPDPTPEELTRSQKEARIIIDQEYTSQFDTEGASLVRHLNATSNASSSQWIGALSIRSYRNFIDFFLSNDQEQIDGDGRHTLDRSRTIADLSSVTHVIQKNSVGLSDANLTQAGFVPAASQDIGHGTIDLYTNPDAFPKSFAVRNAQFAPAADEVRNLMQQPEFDPLQIVYINGPKPPDNLAPHSSRQTQAATSITHYSDSRVDVQVSAPEDVFVVVTDTSTPQWQAYVDNQPAPYYTAYSLFKAAHVPAGQHTVSFRYESPAIELSRQLTIPALALVFLFLIPPHVLTGSPARANRREKSNSEIR